MQTTSPKDFKIVVEYRIQGVDFHRHDLLKEFVRKSIPVVIFRGDLEKLSLEHFKRTGISTDHPPGFDDYIINLKAFISHE